MSAPPDIPGLRWVRELASGGCSTVHLYAEDSEHIGREVAVKVLKDTAVDESARRAFRVEADSMANLGAHPNIVLVLKADVAPDGRRFLVMQYYPNPDLGGRVAHQPFAVPAVLKIGVQIGCAVETAHRAGVLHRDIKPANILTNKYGEPALTDFGIAGQVAAIADDDDVMLSVPWAPPEVVDVSGNGKAGVWSDVYSLGATLWHLLTGRSPFEVDGHNSYEELAERIRAKSVPPVGRGAPQSLERLLRWSMDKNPNARPESAERLALELREIERELGLPQTPMVLEDQHGPVAIPVKAPKDLVAPTRFRPPPTSIRQPRSQPTSFRPRPAEPVVPQPDPVKVTQLRRVVAPVPEPTVEPPRRRRIWPVALTGVGAVAAAVIVGLVIMSGGETPAATQPSTSTTAAGPEQDAGVLGQNLPPGKPAIAAKRLNNNTVRFTWTYSAQLDNDTFRWQTQDGTLTGTTTTPTVDLAALAGSRACLQIKVIRADGSNANTEWSPVGCEQP